MIYCSYGVYLRIPTFKPPGISHLKQELENIDISTNTFVKITSHVIPLDNKVYHQTLGLITASNRDTKQAVELVQFQHGTSLYQQRSKGTIVTSVDDRLIKSQNNTINK